MKKRLIRPRVTIRYPDDVARLVTVANDAGYEIDDAVAQWAWEQHSEEMCAGWLTFQDETDADLIDVLLKYLEEDRDTDWQSMYKELRAALDELVGRYSAFLPARDIRSRVRFGMGPHVENLQIPVCRDGVSLTNKEADEAIHAVNIETVNLMRRYIIEAGLGDRGLMHIWLEMEDGRRSYIVSSLEVFRHSRVAKRVIAMDITEKIMGQVGLGLGDDPEAPEVMT